MIEIQDVSKEFVLYHQASALLPVLVQATLEVLPGECVGLVGPSGSGKSSLLRMVYGNYRVPKGSIRVAGLDVAKASPREILRLRRETLGYVSQFLRVVPRVPTLDVVCDPLLQRGISRDTAEEQARTILSRLNIPERLWSLSPTTFSGGEQQRVNIARGFLPAYPALLLDEPTASLDPVNREVVLGLIEEAKASGAAVLGIFHDVAARDKLCDRLVDMSRFMPEAAA
jgi:alpha-D-ribose 1-methylphosphonate 5-triphosphate synthase subunit PhnL